ncbi:Nudix hydrolase 26, chloroplastic [Turnera subulata]|uniref:Nudix hydrolase 26, chloroplastic n=1 Tax=Turnera subulata TaxID=218843 RepID=A0A9Q0FAJ2_9ROSI|nr:Nudix hydrolase 26, chloroplastic [Turnera subulata]
MAFFCRSIFFSYSPLHHPPSLRSISNPTPSSPIYPFKPSKFTKLPLLHQSLLHISRLSSVSVCTSSLSAAASASMDSPPEGYRKNVGICLINPSKKIFAASRLDIPDSWQMPQGGIDESEDPKIAAMRELKEETGVSSAEVIAETPNWLTYDFPPQVRENLKQRWGSDWKGQAQKWFLLKFTGTDEEVNLLGDGSEKPEFGEWKWMSPEQIIDLAVDFKKPVYKEVLSTFAPYLQ